MLLEFTVGNFLSFKEKKTFSLEASSITEHKENVIEKDGFKVLSSAVIYGANSSGKSNFIKALDFMVNTVKKSSKLNSTDTLKTVPFLLHTETENKPSYFEILFLDKGNQYRYGFELDSEKIHAEWLYLLREENNEEDLCFIRTIEGIGVSDFFEEAKGLESKTRDNGLFLTLVDQFNGKLAKEFYSFLTNEILILSGINHKHNIEAMDNIYSIEKKKDSFNEDSLKFIKRLKLIHKKLIKQMGLGFESFYIEDDDSKDFRKRVNTIHNKYNIADEIETKVEFKMIDSESSGTNKVFDLSGFVVAALSFGSTLIIDELDSKLHPILTQEIIKLFNNHETNPKHAQLIFTTHDTNLLSANLFRRDQIWFTEKDEVEATDLYSLIEFKDNEGKKIRKDRSFEKDYIKGRYGAIPFISNLQDI